MIFQFKGRKRGGQGRTNISVGYNGKRQSGDPADMQCGENGQQGAKNDDDEPIEGGRMANGKGERGKIC